MYFKDKSDTNIDSEFKDERKLFKINFDFGKWKWPFIILLGIILLVVIIVIIAGIGNKYTLELNGDSIIKIYQGNEYVEPGYYAVDKKNRDISSDVKITGNVDSSLIGEYTITYSLGKVTKRRYVSVVEKPVGATYINLLGDLIVNLKVGDTYQEPGYVVVDTVDVNLSDKVEIDSNVDTSKIGVYRIIYTVVNSSGITSSKTRTVMVTK